MLVGSDWLDAGSILVCSRRWPPGQGVGWEALVMQLVIESFAGSICSIRTSNMAVSIESFLSALGTLFKIISVKRVL